MLTKTIKVNEILRIGNEGDDNDGIGSPSLRCIAAVLSPENRPEAKD